MKKQILSVLLTLCMLLSLLPAAALNLGANAAKNSYARAGETYTLHYTTANTKYVTMSDFVQNPSVAWEYRVQAEKGKNFEFQIIADENYTLPKTIEIASGQVRYAPGTDFTYDPTTGAVKIFASGDIPEGASVYIKAIGSITTAGQLQTALGGGDFAAVSGNIVTLKRDSAIATGELLHIESADFTLDLAGKTLTLDGEAVLGLLASGGLTLQNGTVAGEGMISNIGGTLNIKSGTYAGIGVTDGTTTIDTGTFENAMAFNSGNEYNPVLTVNGGSFSNGITNVLGTLTINGGDFGGSGLMIMGTTAQAPTHIKAGTFAGFLAASMEEGTAEQTLADCIETGSKVYKYDNNTKGAELTGDTLMVSEYTTPFLVEGPDDPNAFKPINGGLTYENSSFFANGNAITLAEGKVVEDEYGELAYTKIYYTDDPAKKVIDLAALVVEENKPTGSTADGFNLALKDIYGGRYGQAVGTTNITVLGGQVHDLYGGGYQANTTTANIVIEGGEQNTVYGGSYQSGDTKTVNLTVTGGEVSNIDPYRDMQNDDMSCTVETINVTVTGCVVQSVSIGNVTNPSLTVGGNVKIDYIFLGSADGYDFVDSFTIDPDLGPSASVGLYFVEAPQSNTTVATSAKASDLKKLSIFSELETPAPYRLVLDGTVIKVVEVPVYDVSGTVTDGADSVDGAEVKLMQGNTKIAETTTDDGAYSFSGIPAGVYNVVVTLEDKTVILLVNLVSADLTGQDLSLPPQAVSSKLDVQEGAPDAVVGGLDTIANNETVGADTKVTIQLTVKPDTAQSQGVIEIQKLLPQEKKAEFLDLKLEKHVTSTSGGGTVVTNLGDSNATVLELVIPYDFTGKEDVMVYRHHGSTATALTPLNARPTAPFTDGTFFADSANSLIYIYAAKFSTYAVAYAEPADVPAPPSQDDGGSDDGSGSYKPNVPAKLPFTDVSKDDWFYDSVGYVYEHGLMAGTSGNAFSPNLGTSRGMIATILWCLEGKPAAKATAPFTDVAADKYYAQGVAWGAENGVVQGYGNGAYGPDDLVTREQLAAILYRYAQYKGTDTSKTDDLTQFSDQPSPWAAEAMEWAVGAAIVSGRGSGVLDPLGTATRAEVAKMLTSLIVLL